MTADKLAPKLQVYDDLDRLRDTPSWQALQRCGDSPFLTLAWFDNLARTCAWRERLHWLCVEDAQGLSLLPLRRHDSGQLESLANFYAALWGPVRTAALEPQAHATSYADWIAAQRSPIIRLHPLDADDATWTALAEALRARGYWVDRYFAFGNWRQSTAGISGADYLAARPSKLRHTVRRVRRKLAAEPGFEARFLDASSSPTELRAAVSDYCSVYANSWKRPEPFPDFVPGLCEVAHREGWLRMGLCYLEGQPVAAQIWLVHRGVASIFKLAYDQRFASRGVGTWISAALSERVIDIDRVNAIDFLAGDDAYKTEWMSDRRERIGLIAFRPSSLKGLLAATLHYGARGLRRMRRR
jgi:hypothetical protein